MWLCICGWGHSYWFFWILCSNWHLLCSLLPTLTLLQLVTGYERVLYTPPYTGEVLGSGHQQLPGAPYLAQVHFNLLSCYERLFCLSRTWRERHTSPKAEPWGKWKQTCQPGLGFRSAIGSFGLDKSLGHLLQGIYFYTECGKLWSPSTLKSCRISPICV